MQTPDELFNRANSFLTQGNLPKALAAFRIVHFEDENEDENKGHKVELQVARILGILGEYDNAVASYNYAINHAPESKRHEIKSEMANLIKKKGSTQQAIRLYREILEPPESNNRGDVLYWLAETLNDRGDRESLNESLELLNDSLSPL